MYRNKERSLYSDRFLCKKLFDLADRELSEEARISALFKNGLPPEPLSEFDKAFGVDPMDFLMREMALPRFEAEMKRSSIEPSGKSSNISNEGPPELSFERVRDAMSKQYTEHTCPAEFYFEKYLTEAVTGALDHTFAEANRLGIVDDHSLSNVVPPEGAPEPRATDKALLDFFIRAFKLFCPLDCIAEHLWRNNDKHPERKEQKLNQHEIPIFARRILQQPEQKPPPLSLTLTVDQAATVIQRRWRGTMVRRRPEIRALRRHMAAARVQYNDPRKLVEELWNRELPLKSEGSNPVNGQGQGCLRTIIQPTPPPLPPFLRKMKAKIEEQIFLDEQKREKNEPYPRPLGTPKKMKAEHSTDSSDSDEITAPPQDTAPGPEEQHPSQSGGSTSNPNPTRKSQISEVLDGSISPAGTASQVVGTKAGGLTVSHPDKKESKDKPFSAEPSKKKGAKNPKSKQAST